MSEIEKNRSDASANAFTLYNEAGNQEQLARQVSVLRDMLFRVIQELQAVKATLRRQQLLEGFEQTMRDTMIGDHGGPGPSPWTKYSIFPFLMSDDLYAREVLGLTEDQITEFANECHFRERLT